VALGRSPRPDRNREGVQRAGDQGEGRSSLSPAGKPQIQRSSDRRNTHRASARRAYHIVASVRVGRLSNYFYETLI
jgi:hypothetical protein